ncbi:aquaporin-11-like [Menidia menidia]
MSSGAVSLLVLAAAVLVSELGRRAGRRLVPGPAWPFLLEAASTFQLCCCTHELKLLGDTARVEPAVGLTLTYSVTLLHLLTFRGASCSPAAALEGWFRGTGPAVALGGWFRGSGASAGAGAAGLMLCQFGAAAAARAAAAAVWALGLSELHRRHQRFGFRCFDPLGGTLLEAMAAELACTFTVQAAAMHAHRVEEKLRAPLISAVITAVVWAGGGVSGAMFNPALAFSVQFPCSGHTGLEYCFVYWLGPLLGMASCVLLFDKVLPFLSGRSRREPDGRPAQKHKTC